MIIFMILAAHIAVAASIAKPLTQNSPGLVFLFALFSHYLIDIIPHWEYKLKSTKNDENNNFVRATVMPDKKLIVKDILNLILDTLIGLLIAFALIQPHLTKEGLFLIFALTSGAILPDLIGGINLFWKKFPVFEITRLHAYLNSSSKKIKNKPLKIILEIAVVIFFVLLFSFKS